MLFCVVVVVRQSCNIFATICLTTAATCATLVLCLRDSSRSTTSSWCRFRYCSCNITLQHCFSRIIYISRWIFKVPAYKGADISTSVLFLLLLPFVHICAPCNLVWFQRRSLELRLPLRVSNGALPFQLSNAFFVIIITNDTGEQCVMLAKSASKLYLVTQKAGLVSTHLDSEDSLTDYSTPEATKHRNFPSSGNLRCSQIQVLSSVEKPSLLFSRHLLVARITIWKKCHNRGNNMLYVEVFQCRISRLTNEPEQELANCI